MSKYKNLNLDQGKIESSIQKYCEENFTKHSIQVKKNNNNKTLVRYIIAADEHEPAQLHIYFRENGSTTINPKVGKNQGISGSITDYLLNEVQIDERDNFTLSFNQINEDHVLLLVEYLKDECSAILMDENVLSSKSVYDFHCEYGDSIKITYYQNKSLLIQGKPIHLYKDVTYFLSEFLSLGDIVKAQSQLIKVEIDPSSIDYEIRSLLVNAIDFLDNTLIKILSSSLTIKKIDIKLADYSLFTYPALRGLEGYLKKLLIEKNVSTDFRDIFEKGNGNRIIRSGIRLQINCSFTENALLICYDYYQMHRHTLFHIDGTPETSRIISEISEANGIIDSVFRLIEDTYRLIKNNS